MNTVIIINLNGNAFHVEEPGYVALRSYLERAQAQLKDNPDKDEITKDLEQAIADKCAQFLAAHKNVITAGEMEEVLKQMGPVESDPSASAQSSDSTQPTPKTSAGTSSPKRLYQIRDGAMISGVCKGIAAYFDIDVTIVRLIFVLLALVTTGAWVLLYIAMMFVIPFANTEEERAIASGQPFNAQEVIDRAKRNYSEFKSSREWRRHWRQQRREWRRHWHENAHWWGHNVQHHAQQWASRTGYAGRVFAGVTIPMLTIVSAALFITWLVALVSLATTGAIFGWTVVESIPLWLAVVLLIIVYNVVASPIRHARRAAYFATGGHNYPWFAAWDGVLWIGFLVLIGWLAYRHIPGAHDFMQRLPEHLQMMWNNIVDSLHHTKSHEPLQVEPTT